MLGSPSYVCSFLLQDPTNLDKFNVSNFFHVKNNMKMTDPGIYSQGWSGYQVLGEIGQCPCEKPPPSWDQSLAQA